LHEILDAVCSVIDPQRVGLRLSPSTTFNDMRDTDPRAHFSEIIASLNRHQLAYLHLIEPNDADERHGAICVPSREFRAIFQGPLLVCDGYTGDKAQATVADGHADLVAFGKAFIANPDLPRRLAEGAPLNPPDVASFYGGDARGYTDYPALG
jgi:N-ethylmaleimide reductase